MKKLFLILILAIGVPVVSTTTSVVSAQTCDINSPCLYTGGAKSESGGKKTITVKISTNGRFVAECSHGVFYVFESTSEEDKKEGSHYVNIDGDKYYFDM